MEATVVESDDLFEDGPFPHIQKSLAMFRPPRECVRRRAALAVAIGWFPLLTLAIAQNAAGHPGLLKAFLFDPAVHCRSLLGVALLILVESVCLSRLEKIVWYFKSAGLIPESEREDFRNIVQSSRRLVNSTVAEVVVTVIAYSLTLYIAEYLPVADLVDWYYVKEAGGLSPSWAGYWTMFVSVPLFLVLILGWFWRVLVWAFLIWRISRLNLRLVAANPDRASGLKFLNTQIFAFTPVAFTFGIITAGAVANRVLHSTDSLVLFERTVAGLLILVMLLFASPLLIVMRNLFEAKVNGVYLYGKLADDVGRKLEEKWIAAFQLHEEGALEAPDFSATTDLYSIVANVHSMELIPIELRSLISLCVATMVPFIPVLLMILPLKVIVHEAITLLL